MEGTGWRVDGQEILTIFEENPLFEGTLESLKQQPLKRLSVNKRKSESNGLLKSGGLTPYFTIFQPFGDITPDFSRWLM